MLLVAGVITVNLVQQYAFGPAEPVETYLDALVAGEAEASRNLIGDGAGRQDALLTDEVYGAAPGRISGYEISDTSTSGNSATVTAEVAQGGSTSSVGFTLTRSGRTGLIFDEWRLDGPEPVADIRFVVPEHLDALTVNGAEVLLPAGDADRYPGLRSVVLPALPGEYVVAPPAPTRYLSYGDEQRITVTPDPATPPGGVLFDAIPTPALEADAVARVVTALDGCIASTEDSPAGCPNRSYLFGDPEDVRDPRWTLDSAPTFTLEQSYEPGVYRLLSNDARATFSYERNAEFDNGKPPRWKREEDTQTLLISATVTVTGDTLEVELD